MDLSSRDHLSIEFASQEFMPEVKTYRLTEHTKAAG